MSHARSVLASLPSWRSDAFEEPQASVDDSEDWQWPGDRHAQFEGRNGGGSSEICDAPQAVLRLSAVQHAMCLLLYLAISLALDMTFIKSARVAVGLFVLDAGIASLIYYHIAKPPSSCKDAAMEVDFEIDERLSDLRAETNFPGLAASHGKLQWNRREDDRRHANFVHTMALGIIHINSEGVIIACNPAAERMLGISFDHVKGGSVFDPRLRILREDGSIFPDTQRPLPTALRTGLCVHDVVMGIQNAQSEQECWVLVNATPEFHPGESKPFQAYATLEDITHRRRQQREIEQKDADLRVILEGAPIILWAADKDAVITLFEGKGLAAVGLRNGEVVGQSALECYRDYPIVVESIRRSLEGNAVSYDVDFGGRNFHTKVMPQRNERGEVTGIMGISIDTTERTLAETELRQERVALCQSETWLAEAQRIAHVGSWEYNVSTKQMRWSDELYRIYGLEPSAGAPDMELMAALHFPEDWKFLNESVKPILESGESCEMDMRFIHSNGETRWAHISIQTSRIPWDDAICFVGTTVDITEQRRVEMALRESEQRQRLALESSHLGAWELNVSQGEFTSITDITKNLFGRSSDDPFTWDDCVAAIHVEDRPRVFEAIGRAIAGRTSDKAEYRIVLPNGMIRWLLSHGTVVTDSPIQCPRLIGVTRDITEQKERDHERALELQVAHDRADRDPLTDLLNHRAFYRQLDAEATRIEMEGGVLVVALLDLDNFKFFNDAYSHPVGDEVLRQVSERLLTICGAADTCARFGGDEFAMLLTGFDADSDPLQVQSQLQQRLEGIGYQPSSEAGIIPIAATVGVSILPAVNAFNNRHAAIDEADDRLRSRKSGDSRGRDRERCHGDGHPKTGFTMLDALITAVDNKDRYTRRHSEDVRDFSLIIARELGLDEETTATVAMAAILHDVGKIGVPDSILRKPAGLTPAEFESIKQHPKMGAVIVSAIPGFESTLAGIRSHHERWDGGGYPDGITGDETPLVARIIAVADAYSAMTSSRPYREGMETGRAEALLEAGAGSQWDAACVAAFLSAMRRDALSAQPPT